jgi:hypothetical protein
MQFVAASRLHLAVDSDDIPEIVHTFDLRLYTGFGSPRAPQPFSARRGE